MSTPIMTPASERACQCILVPPPPRERPHQWHPGLRAVRPASLFYSNDGTYTQYKGQVWRRDGQWEAAVRLQGAVHRFQSQRAAQEWVEAEVARLEAAHFCWAPEE